MAEAMWAIAEGTFHLSPEEAQAERVRQALLQLQECDGLPIARQCCICKEPMDKPSEFVMDVRNKIEHLISHTYHEDCYEKWLKDEIII